MAALTVARSLNQQLLLPSQRTLLGVARQGWSVLTQIKPSTIPGAGNGRFMMENVAAQKCVCIKPTVRVSSLQSLSCVAPDECLLFETTDCLEKYISLNVDHSRERVIQEMAHFMWSLDGKNTYLNASTWTMNHADGLEMHGNLPTIEHSLERLGDGTLSVVSRAMQNLAVGTELMNNYREFVMPDFYLDFCDAHGFKDVRSAVLEAVGA